jgi:hypothetical protein
MHTSIPVIIVVALVAGGCAAGPSKSPTTAADAVASAADLQAKAVVPPASTTALTAVAPSATSSSTDVSKAKPRTAGLSVPGGFRPRHKDGQVMWCKKVARTGTRFEEEVCLNEADLILLQRESEEDRVNFRRNQTICGVGLCGSDG